MGIEGLPPVSGDQMPLIGPSDEQLKDDYASLFNDFTAAWSAYEKDPSFQNLEGLEKVFSNLLSFFKNNKQQMAQMCNQNGWGFGGPGGYDTNIEGAINNLSSMRMPPEKTYLQMLDEALTSVQLMMTTKSK